MFSAQSVRNARAVDDSIRELAPVVWLERENIAMLGRHEHVSKGLVDWKSFSNTSRPWHDPNSVRPEILLTDDPPRHTQVRAVIGRALSPKAMKQMEDAFKREAEALVDELMSQVGAEIDAVSGITARYVHKVLARSDGLASRRPRGHDTLRQRRVGDDGAAERRSLKRPWPRPATASNGSIRPATARTFVLIASAARCTQQPIAARSARRTRSS